jgi:hypothetical protein
MNKFAVQSRYTRVNFWYRAPRNVRFSDRLVRQLTRTGREYTPAATVGRFTSPSSNKRAPLAISP